MAKAGLRNDVVCGYDSLPQGVSAGLDEQVCDDQVEETVEVLPTLIVRQRTKTGYNDDGDPEFTWTEVVEGLASLWEAREEVDDVAGFTYVKAKATMLYDGDEAVKETAVVSASTGGRFRVTSVSQVDGILSFEMTRMDDG